MEDTEPQISDMYIFIAGTWDCPRVRFTYLLAVAITEKERWDKRCISPHLKEQHLQCHGDPKYRTCSQQPVLCPHFFLTNNAVSQCGEISLESYPLIKHQKDMPVFYPHVHCPPYSMAPEHGRGHPSHSAPELGAKTV